MISESLHKKFSHIPKEALREIILFHLIKLRQGIGRKEILRPRKIVVKGLGTFHVGGKIELRKFSSLNVKITAKCVKKSKTKKRENDINYLL